MRKMRKEEMIKKLFELPKKLQKYKDHVEKDHVEKVKDNFIFKSIKSRALRASFMAYYIANILYKIYLESIKSRAFRAYFRANTLDEILYQKGLRNLWKREECSERDFADAIKKYREAAHFFELLERKIPRKPTIPVYFNLASECLCSAATLSLYLVDEVEGISDEKKAKILQSALFFLYKCIEIEIKKISFTGAPSTNKDTINSINRALWLFFELKKNISVPEDIENKMSVYLDYIHQGFQELKLGESPISKFKT